jgi:hypothetical protein
MADADHDPFERLHDVRADLLGRTGFLPVLLLLLASTICGLLIGDDHGGAVITVALTGAALMATVFRSTTSRPLRILTLGFALLIAVAVSANGDLTSATPASRWLPQACYVAILAIALPLVLVRALRHRRVTINTLCATVSAYLLIGLLFAGIYRLYATVAPPFFAQDPGKDACAVDPRPKGCPTSGQYSYFSFITMSTVGYGDLSPGSDPARAIVTFEAIAGQVFVITALARVVSLLGEERKLTIHRAQVGGADDEDGTAA